MTSINSMTNMKSTTNNTESCMECSQEFKLEMENSICSYFEKYQLEENDEFLKNKSELVRDKTLIDNTNNDVEYITPTPSLKGISDFMINQIFSTEKIIPIDDSSDEEESAKQNNDTTNPPPKMSSCNSDVTLNNEETDIKKVHTDISNNENEEEENEAISKSFAVEFIDLLDINMKELNSKKDDFHVIGLKKIEEEKEEIEKTEEKTSPEVKIQEEFLENKSKSKDNKRSKHISIFSSLDRKSSSHSKTSHLYRSKSASVKSTKKHDEVGTGEEGNKVKKSKSKLGLSKIFKSMKKRMSQI